MYDSQFMVSDNFNKGLLEWFDKLLKDYFNSEKPHGIGILTVSAYAET